MSQSLGWADNFILAMAPLGILTIIVAAIRVGGPSWLKGVIGRARESLADAESELMSSTSDEVREFWDGQQIVKMKAKEMICEFVILVPEERGKGKANADGSTICSTVEDIETPMELTATNKFLECRSQ